MNINHPFEASLCELRSDKSLADAKIAEEKIKKVLCVLSNCGENKYQIGFEPHLHVEGQVSGMCFDIKYKLQKSLIKILIFGTMYDKR